MNVGGLRTPPLLAGAGRRFRPHTHTHTVLSSQRRNTICPSTRLLCCVMCAVSCELYLEPLDRWGRCCPLLQLAAWWRSRFCGRETNRRHGQRNCFLDLDPTAAGIRCLAGDDKMCNFKDLSMTFKVVCFAFKFLNDFLPRFEDFQGFSRSMGSVSPHFINTNFFQIWQLNGQIQAPSVWLVVIIYFNDNKSHEKTSSSLVPNTNLYKKTHK